MKNTTIRNQESREIEVIVADYEELGLRGTWEQLLPYLTDKEREKALKFKFEADRIRSVTGACLIKAYARKAFPDDDISIRETELGKPYVAGHAGYEFNLSHSGWLVVLAFDKHPVGVDVEKVKDKDWRIFHRYLTDDEMSMIEEAESPGESFFEVWTIREAFAKEEGLGLKILDRDFLVDYDRHEIGYDGRRLYFKTFDYDADNKYKISVCSAYDASEAELHILSSEEWAKISMSLMKETLI